jgi:hypothetical protein
MAFMSLASHVQYLPGCQDLWRLFFTLIVCMPLLGKGWISTGMDVTPAVIWPSGASPDLVFHLAQVPGNLMIDGSFISAPDIAFSNAMGLTNTQLHMSPIDDSMSGTTAITALIRGRKVYVANVGDSRGILGEMRGDQLVAVPLSQDHTPFRCTHNPALPCPSLHFWFVSKVLCCCSLLLAVAKEKHLDADCTTVLH